MIELLKVSKCYTTPLLSSIDLVLNRGEVWGLIGPAASGKSVLLKLICGLVPADSGQIRISGEPITDLDEMGMMAIRSRFGMLFQNNALFDFMTVLENVAFPLIRAGEPRNQARERAASRLRKVGLSGSEKKYPSQLSGGMQKRVGIARASICQPEIVIYDEPTAGLDPVTTSKIYDLLRADQEHSEATVIVVSSDVDGLRQFAGRLALLHNGRLRYDGPGEAIEESPDPVVRQFIRGDLEGPL